MTTETVRAITTLRMSIARIGESTEPPWWNTIFFTEESDAFLNPLFPRSHWAARINAVSECAARAHDEHIGVSQRVFHLFRFPEFVEQAIAEEVLSYNSDDTLYTSLLSHTLALQNLESLADKSFKPTSGPTLMGTLDSILSGAVISKLATAYSHAAQNSTQVFPYFDDAA